MPPSIQTNDLNIRKASDRGRTRIGWLDSAHSFSFGRYHDPAHMGYRSLRVINDDVIAAGAGFGEHGHDNMEIISWMLAGQLRHGDSMGHDQLLTPGEAQVMSAGTGIRHSEFNGSPTDPAHLIQIWIEPDRNGHTPRYDQKRFDAQGRANRFQAIASGRGTGEALPIHQDADVLVADVAAGAQVPYELAEGRHAYVHIATGSVEILGVPLSAADAAMIDRGGTILIHGIEASGVMLFDLG